MSTNDASKRGTCQGCQRMRVVGDRQRNDTPTYVQLHKHRR